jgi:hypothetical protein
LPLDLKIKEAILLSVFGDESADETEQRVFAVGGVIGDEDRWNWLEERWIICNEGTPFHATDCDSDGGDYKGREHSANKNLYKSLTILLAESGLGGWGFAIDLQAQRRVFPESPDIAYYKCFLEVLLAMRNCAAYNNETVKYTFDLRRKDKYNAGYLYSRLVEHKDWKDHIFTKIAFECSPENNRVQAADLFARETMKALDNHFGPVKRPPRKSFETLVETGRFHVEAIGEEWFQDLKRQMDFDKELGPPEEYRAWLKEHDFSHNTLTMFRYIEWRNREK